MSRIKTIGHVVSEMSMEERNAVLEKLKMQASVSPEPMHQPSEAIPGSGGDSGAAEYRRLPWIKRLFYALMSFFKRKPADEIYSQEKFVKLGRRIQSKTANLFNYEKGLLLHEFYNQLFNLKEAGHLFFSALNSSINNDKGSFYAFLGSLEMSDAHASLQMCQQAVIEKNANAKDFELRNLLNKEMENAMSKIGDANKAAMYKSVRALVCLKELSSFSFEPLLLSFSVSAKKYVCPVDKVKDTLLTLNNILFSLKQPPSMELLQSLFVFYLHEKKEDESFDMDREMRYLLVSAEEAIETIRDFNKKIPLTGILRCAFRDMELQPALVPGGEDWFLAYRDFWKKQSEAAFTEFAEDRREKETQATLEEFFDNAKLYPLENAASEFNPHGFPLPEAFALSFLRTFYDRVFLKQINGVIRPLLLEGEFFKQENKVEFAEAYKVFNKIEEEIAGFDGKLSEAGDYGARYAQASNIANTAAKNKELQALYDESSDEASGLIQRFSVALVSLVNVLGGILNTNAGSKYDTVSNMKKFSNRSAEPFGKSIATSIEQLQKASKMLDSLKT
ncbi:MAG: DUF5312 domain-containing protein [Spirochaetes bacterium]|nr:DUF5312 domain-containing protein [Spirochaetota bacterium]